MRKVIGSSPISSTRIRHHPLGGVFVSIETTGLEPISMQAASGILRPPVQKLVATIRFAPANRRSSPISSTKHKKSELLPDWEWVRIFCGHPHFCGCLFPFYRSGPFSRAALAFVPAFSAIRASILWEGESTESDTAKHGGMTTAFLQQGQRRTLQAIGN